MTSNILNLVSEYPLAKKLTVVTQIILKAANILKDNTIKILDSLKHILADEIDKKADLITAQTSAKACIKDNVYPKNLLYIKRALYSKDNKLNYKDERSQYL